MVGSSFAALQQHGSSISLYEAILDCGLQTNLQLCLDAGSAASYTSGASWLDLSGHGYDFFLGATGSGEASDPTFNGTVGALAVGNYWSVDGGDYFTYDTTNETWMQSYHKDNAILTMLAWIYFGSLASTTGIAGDRGGAGSETGFCFNMNPNFPQFQVVNAGASPLNVTATGTAITTGAWHLLGVSLNEATGAGGGFFYTDGAYNQVSGSDTFTSTYTSPASGNASQTMQILTRGGASVPMLTGGRIAGFMAWSGTALTKVQIDAIWTRTRIRFGV